MTFVDLIAQAVDRYVPSAVEKAIKLHKAYQKSEQTQEDLEKYHEDLLNVIAELAEKIFSYILNYLREKYDIEAENLSSEELIASFYSADGKTIFDRVQEYAEEKDLTSEKLIAEVMRLWNQPELLEEMGRASKACAPLDACEMIYTEIKKDV